MEPDLLAELGTCQHACAESPPMNAGKPQHLNPIELLGHPRRAAGTGSGSHQQPPGCDHKACATELLLRGTAGQERLGRQQDQQGSRHSFGYRSLRE